MKIIKDLYDNEIVLIENPDGSTVSMLKATYDEQQAANDTNEL